MNNDVEEFKDKAKNKEVICFGAGKIFNHVYIELISKGVVVSKVIDNDKNKWGRVISGVKVFSPAILDSMGDGQAVIIITTKFQREEIKNQIKECSQDKFPVFFWPLSENLNELFYMERNRTACLEMYCTIWQEDNENEVSRQYILEKRDSLKGSSLVIPRLPLMITTRCTLRCEQCNNLMPYYKNPKDYSFKEIKIWMDNLLSVIDELVCCELVGGEPFLYRELDAMLEYAINQTKINRIEITTNGSVLPNEKVLNLLCNKKVIVKISDYKGRIKLDRFIELMKTKGIHYLVHTDMVWTKVGGVESRGKTLQELQAQALRCEASKTCRTILNGKLYICSRAASLMESGLVEGLEFVDLTCSDRLRERIEKFMYSVPCEACDYCDSYTVHGEAVEPAIQKED